MTILAIIAISCKAKDLVKKFKENEKAYQFALDKLKVKH